MTTLKEIYRNHGYEVNRDDQKGIGNKCLENVEECFKVWLTKKQDEIIEEQKLYGFDPLIPVINIYDIFEELKHSPLSTKLSTDGDKE
jgi:hypothetical protein